MTIRDIENRSWKAHNDKKQKKLNEVEEMKLKVEEPKSISDGAHEGTIIAIEYRNKPFDYTDLVIEFESGRKLKYGVPTSVSVESKLGKLLLDFGASLEIGGEIDPEDVFVNQQVTFMTMRDSKGYSNIVRDSLKIKK